MRKGDVEGDGAIVAVVGNYPLKYFVERIGSPMVEARFPATVSGDPAYWEPTPEDVVAMQQSDLILLNGASYEKWLKKVSLPQSKLVDTAAGFEDRLIQLEDAVTHSHGLEGEHEHSGTAFTTWMDLSLAVDQARAVKDTLVARHPKHKGQFEEQCADLEKDLQEIGAGIKSSIAQSPGTPVVFSHPVYQYFERAYGVNGKSVHWEPDAMPDESMWNEFSELLEQHPAKWMIWEGAPEPEIVARLAELGVRSAVVAPCGNEPEKGDFLAVMRKNVEELQRVYAEEE
jgi:zinc transport system substrate-binding protein